MRCAAASAFQRDAGIRLRRANRRPEIENSAGQQRERAGKSEDAPIQTEIELDGVSRGANEPHDPATEYSGERHAEDCARKSKYQAFGERLPDEAPARCTKS